MLSETVSNLLNGPFAGGALSWNHFRESSVLSGLVPHTVKLHSRKHVCVCENKCKSHTKDWRLAVRHVIRSCRLVDCLQPGRMWFCEGGCSRSFYACNVFVTRNQVHKTKRTRGLVSLMENGFCIVYLFPCTKVEQRNFCKAECRGQGQTVWRNTASGA